jgi:uncharacterized protein YjiS (DUF1127 family)
MSARRYSLLTARAVMLKLWMLRMVNRLGYDRTADQRRRTDTVFDGSFPRNLPAIIRIWIARNNERHELGELTDHELADIGVSRAQALFEARKWFWQR